jgi:tetratricopeptide (TPR) repeat protein
MYFIISSNSGLKNKNNMTKIIFTLILALFSASLFADYAEKYIAAEHFFNQAKNEEARLAFEKLAGATQEPRARDQCLSMAVRALVRQDKPDEAMQLAGKINDHCIAANCRMEVFLKKNAAAELVAAYAGEDLGQWPEYLNHHGYFKRGKAYYLARDHDKAADDLAKAIELAGCNNIMKAEALQLLANMAGDPGKKLEWTLKIIDLKGIADSHFYLEAVMWVTDVYIRKNEFAGAEEILKAASPRLEGYWKFRVLSRRGDLELARGNKAGAKEYYSQALKIEHQFKPFIDHVKKQLEGME